MIGKSVVAGTAVAGVAIAGLVKKSVDAYAEFEQLNGGLEALFGKGSKNMQQVAKMSEDAYKNLTLSQNDYLKAFEGSYSIINNGISKQANAIKYTNKMIQMSTDLYNTYGGTVEQYQGAINWALKGTFSYLDNLNVGIKGTKEGFIEAANASGILNKKIKDTSELTNDQILDVIQYYVKSAGALNRTQEEAASTIQGSMNMVKATWNNLIAGFSKDGANVNKLIKQFINAASVFIGQLIPIIERALTAIINALPSLLNKASTVLPGMLQRFLTKSLPVIISMTINMLMNLIKSLVKAIPKIIPPVITAILDALLMLLDNIDMLIDCGIQLLYGIIDGIIAALPVLIEKAPIIIIKLVGALIRAFPKLAAAAYSIPLKVWSGITKGLPGLIKKVPSIIKNIIKALKGEFTKLKDTGKNIVKGLWNGAKDMKDWVIDKFKGLGKSILNGMKKALGIKSPSREFAKIGRYAIIGFQVGAESQKKNLEKTIKVLSTDIQKQMKGNKTNYKNIGKLMGNEIVDGLNSSLKSLKDTATKWFEQLGKVDLFNNNKLTDLSQIKQQLTDYGNNLNKLKNKVPKNLFSEIMGMDREEGLAYTNALLSMNENALKDYVNNYNAIQKQASNISNNWYESEAKAQAKKLSDKYSETLKKELSALKKLMGGLGKNASKGLINGMLSQTKNLKGASKTMADDIIKSLKKALKIKSPSRVMAELGQYTTAGYIEGIASMKQDLNKMMNDTFSLSPSLTGTMNNTLSPNVNVVNNVNVETDPLGQVVSKIKTFSGGAKNDYNYGYGG